MKDCPTCRRAFTKLADYPEICIDKIEVPPNGLFPTEADVWYPISEGKLEDIAENLLANQPLQTYITELKELTTEERTILPKEIQLPFNGSFFPWTYDLPIWPPTAEHHEGWRAPRRDEYFLGFQEKELGISCLNLYTHGPNLGSAGGPTLQEVGTVLRIHYSGHLSV